MNVVVFLAGGLGLFLMGMKFMSDGLQTVAGPSLKSLIGAVTNKDRKSTRLNSSHL